MSHQRETGRSSVAPARASPIIRVVAVAVAVVVGVLGARLLAVLVPAVGRLVQVEPTLIVILVIVTVAVLLGALRPRPGPPD